MGDAAGGSRPRAVVPALPAAMIENGPARKSPASCQRSVPYVPYNTCASAYGFGPGRRVWMSTTPATFSPNSAGNPPRITSARSTICASSSCCRWFCAEGGSVTPSTRSCSPAKLPRRWTAPWSSRVNPGWVASTSFKRARRSARQRVDPRPGHRRRAGAVAAGQGLRRVDEGDVRRGRRPPGPAAAPGPRRGRRPRRRSEACANPGARTSSR